MISRTSSWFYLLGLIYLLLVSGGLPVEAKAAANKVAAPVGQTAAPFAKRMNSNPWSNIKGFRSAKFGMDMKNVYRSISKDFKISKSKVTKTENPTESTTALSVKIPNLFSTGDAAGGAAVVAYVFGHKSKKLMQVNVLWGKGAAENVDGKSVVETANLLRDHFAKKRYQKKLLVMNGSLSPTQTLMFRGLDKKGRMCVVMLTTPATNKKKLSTESLKSVSLLLSYIEKPGNPDVRKVIIKEDEF